MTVEVRDVLNCNLLICGKALTMVDLAVAALANKL